MTAARRPLAAAGVLAVLLLGAAGAGSSLGAAGAATCLGAAERDSLHPCINRSRSFLPALEHRDDLTASGCRKVKQEPGLDCAFGTPSARPRRTVALIGDSHALHWRGPLDVVARAKRWRALSLWTPLCLFSTAVRYEDSGVRNRCVQWNRDVRTWLARHPEVSTVFISQAVFIPISPPPGKSALATKVAGFVQAWGRLPRTVKHIVVIRDVPGTSEAAFDCIARVMAAGDERPGQACREERRAVSPRDPAFEAAMWGPAERVQAIDMTRYFCDPLSCFPVIGGVLVHRDLNHMTIDYARTLGPYLLRAVRRLAASW